MPSLPDNPFTNRSTIIHEDQFIGRSIEIANILSSVHNGNSISLVGDRRIGKSSLLYHLYLTGNRRLDDAGKTRFKFIYLDLHNPKLKTINGLCRMIIDKLKIKYIQNFQIQNNLDSLCYLSEALDKIQEKKILPVLLLDEFESLIKRPDFNDDFFDAFRAFTSMHKLAFVISSHHTLLELTEKNSLTSPFWNIFKIVKLGEFIVDNKIDEVTEFLTCFWKEELTPNDEEKAFLISYCSKHPVLMQVVSYWVLENRKLKLNETVLKQEIDNELSSYFRSKKALLCKWLKGKIPRKLEKIVWTSEQIGKTIKNLSPFSIKIGKD